MVLEALHPNQSEGDIVSEPQGSETLGKQGDTTIALSPPQAETTVYDTRLPGTANPIPNSASIYRYSPLSANSIRLLRLQPHSDEHAPIQCQLFEYPLSDSRRGTHLYEALSYVWGSEEKPQRVSTNEGDLYVTENLHAALLRLRDRSFERIIWADAICINQDDIKERNYQVQAMAKIYARASRVIVWLEEATSSPPGDSEVSENVCRALEEISSAAGGQLAKFSDEEAIHTLLRQSWFERIWVLQEVAAARHVLIMCHSMDIDGYAFCAGLNALNIVLSPGMQSRIRSVAYLIRSAGLRPKHTATLSDRFSLNIRPLGELVDMYHNRKAKDWRDKVYALLGMSSDTPVGLLPNYSIPWRNLFRRLVHSLIGEQASIKTWDDQQVAVIEDMGCVLGVVSSVSSAGAWDDGQNINVNIVLKDHSEDLWKWDGWWAVQASAMSIQQGDFICLLQGASKPTIIRLCEDYCVIVAISVTPSGKHQISGEPFNWIDCSRWIQAYPLEFLLVWDWEMSSERFWSGDHYEHLLNNRVLEHEETRAEDRWDKVTRFHSIGLLLIDLGKYEEGIEKLLKAIEAYERTYEKDHKGYKEIREMIGSGIKMEATTSLNQKVETLRIMADILGQRGDYATEVTEYGVIQVARSSNNKLMELLLYLRGDQVPITEEVVKTAARNALSKGGKVIELLLDRFGDNFIVTEEVMKAAAGNWSSGERVMELLLSRYGHQIPITEEVMKIAVGNILRGERVIEQIIFWSRYPVPITEEVVKIAAGNASLRGVKVIKLLFDRYGDQILITEEVMKVAAGNILCGEKVIEQIFDQYGDQVPTTEEVVKIAARNRSISEKTRQLLLDQLKNGGATIHITASLPTRTPGSIS